MPSNMATTLVQWPGRAQIERGTADKSWYRRETGRATPPDSPGVDGSGDFDLGGLDDELVLAGRRRGQLQLRHLPAVVLEGAGERRLARHVAGEPDRRRVEPG